ncbi:MAG: acyltransferase domain-containing protein, partial [Myxococcota bacterium]|nr:acyltransferase domain-containing protein [Myxococcota bacterium]
MTSIPEATAALKAVAEGGSHEAVYTARARGRGRVVFVFPGQGSQWPAMGRALLEESPVFAEAIESCDAALQPLLGWSVTSVLRGDVVEGAEDLERADVVQPLLFAMAVALAALWRSLGMRPAAVVGHSQGEVPAAVVAGALTLEEGAKVVVARSRLVCRLAGKGGMAVMELPFAEVQERLKPWADSLEIAVVNTPTSTVVSGDVDAIDELVTSMDTEDVFCRKVNVDYASHCAHVDEVVPELLDALADIAPGETSVPFYSAVTGEVVPGAALDADYWCRNLRETVRMDKALAALMADGFGVLIEVSPHPILAMPLTMASMESKGVVVGTLERDGGGMVALYHALGVLHAQGVRVPWSKVLADLQGDPVLLPTYAFQRRSYWLEGSVDYAALAGAGWTPGPIPAESEVPHGGLRAELMDLPEEERAAAVTEVICTEMAVVMGIENPSEIPVDKPLKELGMDSLRILECRNRIVSRIEMDIAVEWVFKYPTPESLGAHLSKELTTAAPAPSVSDAPAVEVTTDAPLWERYLHHAMDKVMEGAEQEGSELLKTSAVLRGHEEQISHYPLTPEPMSPLTMAEGATPPLFFIPAFPPTGVLQYAQIAPHLEGTREMRVTRHPGYQPNETLLTWDA